MTLFKDIIYNMNIKLAKDQDEIDKLEKERVKKEQKYTTDKENTIKYEMKDSMKNIYDKYIENQLNKEKILDNEVNFATNEFENKVNAKLLNDYSEMRNTFEKDKNKFNDTELQIKEQQKKLDEQKRFYEEENTFFNKQQEFQKQLDEQLKNLNEQQKTIQNLQNTFKKYIKYLKKYYKI
jgi:hypothetical protein